MLAVSSSLTTVTLFEPIPPKKPVPVIVIPVVVRLDPVDGLNAVTVGAGVVTVNFVVLVTFVPPAEVTFTL